MPFWTRAHSLPAADRGPSADLPSKQPTDLWKRGSERSIGSTAFTSRRQPDELLIEIERRATRTLPPCPRASVGAPDGAQPGKTAGTPEGKLIIVCGLSAEAKIARGPGVIVIQGGGDGRRLAAELEAAAVGARAIISFGIAGGISPGQKPGDVWIADAVLAPDGTRFKTDSVWSEAIARDLKMPFGTLIGVDTVLGDKAGKAAAYRATGAVAVDMESHIVADIAARHGLQFAAIRVVTDSAERSLPHAARVGMRSDGRVDLAAIFASLARNPSQLPSLIRTGLDARAAFAALLRCREGLGPRFALLDL